MMSIFQLTGSPTILDQESRELLCTSMDHLGLFFLSFFFLYFNIKAQETPLLPPTEIVYASTSITHQTIIILIVFLSFLFFATFVLIIYQRLRHINRENNLRNDLILTISSPRFSGIEKSLINSLPSFTFSSLQGSKEGLECAVCLSKFIDTEVLRLLPQCKHAFHGTCVDKWLEKNSNCPLCRQKVDTKDIRRSKTSLCLRIPQSHSEAVVGMPTVAHTSDPPQSLQQEEPHEVSLPYTHSNTDDESNKFKEEMEGRILSNGSFSVSDLSIRSASDIKPKSGRTVSPVITSRERSMSEIMTLKRFSDFSGGNVVEEERMRAWLATVKQTVPWFGSKASSKQSQCSGNHSMV